MKNLTTNEVIVRHNFISKVLFKDGDASLSKDLKIKVMSMRIEYGKIHKVFDDDVQEFTKGITSERFNELASKTDRTEAETKEYQDLINQYNAEIQQYIANRAEEEIAVNDYSLTEEEFNEILEVNASNDVVINEQEIQAPDFLEAIHSIFVDNK